MLQLCALAMVMGLWGGSAMALPDGGDAAVAYRVPAQAIGCATATAARHLSDGRVGTGCHPAGAAGRWVLAQRDGDVIALRRGDSGRHDRAVYFRMHDVTRDTASGSISALWHGLRNRATAMQAALLQGPGGGWAAHRHALHWRAIFAAGVTITVGWPVLRLMVRWWGRRRARAICAALVMQHADTLRLRRRQLLGRNSYGVVKPEKWHRERDEFIATIMRPALRQAGRAAQWPRIAPWVTARIEQVARGTPQRPDIVGPGMDPLEYEQYCAAELRDDGWQADTTVGSGDQGADIIATRRGLRMVVQCKLYSRTVGNDAVQQISAARAHYDAAVAVVVSNAAYTRAARQLARTNGVWLLHHDELRGLAHRLKQGVTPAVTA
ncbi:restriction endonuclease [Novacetimonas hansenii]|uniref:restriction endonuclease n=1 Tax=Novacetimonas hansenii TaxID=436 RepID=UPI001EF05927|nr:restriction endonuclease [Novacetimonas hansenii]